MKRSSLLAPGRLVAILPLALGILGAARAQTNTPPADTRPPGGDGEQFYRVFLTQNDANGDGVVTKTEFRGSASRFDAMDKNRDGKLDRRRSGSFTNRAWPIP